VPEPEHLAVTGRCLILEAEQMEHAVGGKEGDLVAEWFPPAPGLSRGLLRADHDLTELEASTVLRSLRVDVRNGGDTFHVRRQLLPERQHIGRSIDLAEALVHRAHDGIGYECEIDLRVSREAVWANRAVHRRADRSEIARRLAGDRDPHAR
jgi:hypothetical protein